MNKLLIFALILFTSLFAACSGDEVNPNKKPNPDLNPGEGGSSNNGIITSLPNFIVDDEQKVTFTINLSDTELADEQVDIYAHTGVITNLSTSSSDWKYVAFEWAENNDKCKLIKKEGNTYTLVFPEGARKFFGVPTEEEIQKIAFVFRSADGTVQIKNEGKDFFIDLATKGINVRITSPSSGTLLKPNESYTVAVIAKDANNIKLLLNKDAKPVAESSDLDLEHTFTASEGQDYTFIAVATKGTETISDTVFYTCLGDSPNKAKPAEAKDGVSVNGNKASFVIYAPKKKTAALLGDFNKYKPSNAYKMNRDGDYFWITIDGIEANKEYGYQFMIDGITVADPYSTKVLDPWNDQYITAAVYPNLKPYPVGLTNDIVSVFSSANTEFQWTASSYKRPKQATLAVYELLVRDFTTEGTIKAVTAKLDYLEKLGINAIELMPIQEFSGNDSWGYNPTFFFAMDKAYGTDDDYKHFIDECHKRDIAVIIDVVFNHADGAHPWVKLWQNSNGAIASDNPFFNVTAPHPYSVFNDFNHTYDKTEEYFDEVLQYLLTEYKVDGFRFDLTKGFTQNNSSESTASNYDQQRIDILKGYADAIREKDADAYIILEHFSEEREENALAAHQDMIMWNNAVHNYSQTVMGKASGSDFYHMGKKARINNIETHDEERIAYKAKTNGATFVKDDLERISSHTQAAYIMHFLTPEPKMMWQFGELAYDISIEEGGRTGRKPVKWNYLDVPARKAIYDALSKAITFRTDNEEMYTSQTPEQFEFIVNDSNMAGKKLVYKTSYGSVVVFANFTNATSTVSHNIGSGEWTNLITGDKIDLSTDTFSADLAAGEYIVITKK